LIDFGTDSVYEQSTDARSQYLPWYALQIQSKLGSVAHSTLCGKSFEAFLPMYWTQRRWSDRVKRLEQPLFPGYMFCRFDARDRLPVLTVPGVVGVVSAGKIPLPVDDKEIAAVRAVLGSGLAAQPWPFLGIGSKVYLERGPLAGVEGVITSIDNVHRLVVSVSLLQRSVAVEIDRQWARPMAGVPNGARAARARSRRIEQAGCRTQIAQFAEKNSCPPPIVEPK
jgi:transcription antitermination factor NusG